MSHPNISKIIREMHFKDLQSGLKRKDADLAKKEIDIKTREDDQEREI